MQFLTVLEIVTPVFASIAVGYAFAYYKTISLEPLIELLLYITIPALVIYSLSTNSVDTNDLFSLSLAATLVVFGSGLLSYIYLKLSGNFERKGFYLTTMFMNSGNIPFPLALLAFGSAGLTKALIYYMAISLLFYSVGIFIVKGRSGATEIFKLPLIYSAIIGFYLSLTGTQVPESITTTLKLLGDATIPLMLLSLGYQLKTSKLSHLNQSFMASLIRIAGGFLLGLLVVELLDIQGISRAIVILSSSMPSAVINFVISYKYNIDKELVASTVALSTLLNIITTPLILMWLMSNM